MQCKSAVAEMLVLPFAQSSAKTRTACEQKRCFNSVTVSRKLNDSNGIYLLEMNVFPMEAHTVSLHYQSCSPHRSVYSTLVEMPSLNHCPGISMTEIAIIVTIHPLIQSFSVGSMFIGLPLTQLTNLNTVHFY